MGDVVTTVDSAVQYGYKGQSVILSKTLRNSQNIVMCDVIFFKKSDHTGPQLCTYAKELG